ncbi:hypothetical protein F383_01694 [Gossypium arboreum]|uniref:Uncharacterized protein n=1 Tax=Gossypium arboreum TaxID=29729 RepID=A0A0B0NEI7_GOSAR|nr:hypothetical protein F383_01694 [Gossypium arboreum]
MKLVYFTRSHTRVCDWPCGTSQYTLQFWHGLVHSLAHGRA